MDGFGFGGTSQFGNSQPIVTQAGAGADKGGGAAKGAATGAMSGAMSGTMAYPGIGTVIGALVGAAAGAAGGAMSAKSTPGSEPIVKGAVDKFKDQPNPFSNAPPGSNPPMDNSMASGFGFGGSEPSPYSSDAAIAENFGFGAGAGGSNPYEALAPSIQQYMQENPQMMGQLFASGGGY